MRFSTFAIAIVLITAIVYGIKQARKPEAALPVLPKDATILAFGDSLTYGFGALPIESYPARLERRIGRHVINAGISGELSSAGLSRLSSLLDEYHPAILILCHGGNDILQNKDKTLLKKNIEKMVQMAQQRHIDILLIAVPEFSLIHLTPLPLYEEIADSYQLMFEPDILSDLLHDNRYKSDTLHPNGQGYDKMAEAVEKKLREKYQIGGK